MIVKEYSTRFNTLVVYALGVASKTKGEREIFIKRLRSDIANVIIGYHAPNSYTKALSRAMNSKVML